jgi:hypothetical protein
VLQQRPWSFSRYEPGRDQQSGRPAASLQPEAVSEALKSFRDGLAIVDRLARADPGDAGWQRDLSVSYAKFADVFKRSGETATALNMLQQGRAIMLRLYTLSPDNAVWKRDLARFDRQIAELTR